MARPATLPPVRPCLARHPDPDPDCLVCRLFTGVRTIRRKPAPACTFRGRPTGESRPWVGCHADPPTRLALHACAVHGKCTTDQAARETKCCRYCPDRRAAVADAEIEVTANGIGDAMVGLAVAAGWKAAHPGKRLVLAVREHLRPWARLFETDALTVGSAGLSPAWKANNVGATHFVNAAAAAPWRGMPTARPLPPAAVAWAEPYRGCVVLAPFAMADRDRDWLRWADVAAALEARGVRTVAVGSKKNARRLAPFRERLAGAPAVRVAALLKVAACVAGNESGIPHVAGALGVPAVVLSAQQIGKDIHFWPTSKVIQAPWPCSGCHWQGPNYSKAKCEPTCPNLQSITPEQVLAAVEPYLVLGPFADLPVAVRPHLARLVVPLRPGATHPVPDRRETVAGFLRHLAGKPSPVVVETGCQREAGDYGAGMSSTVFGLFLQACGGRLVSLDNDPAHVATARRLTAGLPVEVVETDSRPWLRAYAGPPIDGLYLDSADCWLPSHSEVNLDETEAALPHLSPTAAVLIDDTWRAGDGWAGKGAKAVPFLISRGWRVERAGYQCLLSSPGSP